MIRWSLRNLISSGRGFGCFLNAMWNSWKVDCKLWSLSLLLGWMMGVQNGLQGGQLRSCSDDLDKKWRWLGLELEQWRWQEVVGSQAYFRCHVNGVDEGMYVKENVYEKSVTLRIFDLTKMLVQFTKVREGAKQQTWERSEDNWNQDVLMDMPVFRCLTDCHVQVLRRQLDIQSEGQEKYSGLRERFVTWSSRFGKLKNK